MQFWFQSHLSFIWHSCHSFCRTARLSRPPTVKSPLSLPIVSKTEPFASQPWLLWQRAWLAACGYLGVCSWARSHLEGRDEADHHFTFMGVWNDEPSTDCPAVFPAVIAKIIFFPSGFRGSFWSSSKWIFNDSSSPAEKIFNLFLKNQIEI